MELTDLEIDEIFDNLGKKPKTGTTPKGAPKIVSGSRAPKGTTNEDWRAKELQEQINDCKDKQTRFSIRYPKVKFQHNTYVKLSELAEKNNLPKVPPPLILAAWHFSSPVDKQERWHEIIEWANLFGYSKLIPNLTDEDYEYD